MSKIDLHIHSNCSDDGELTPQEIVARCKEQDMELIAITDHNSVRGVSEAMAVSDGLRILSGVELDCTYHGRNFHLLGYSFDHNREEFTKIEQDILKQEQAAAEQKISLFCKASGIPVDVKKVLDAAQNGVVTGELIAQIVLARADAERYELLHPYLSGGAKSDMPNVRFYWDFFSEGKAAYVPISYLSLPDAAALIHSVGGFAVLAHPGQNLVPGDKLLSLLLTEKIDGIETFSSYHSKEVSAYYMEIARSHHKIITCGSDFHGKHKPDIRIGGHGALWDDSRLFLSVQAF